MVTPKRRPTAAGRPTTTVPRMNRQRVVQNAHEGAKDSRGTGVINSPYDFFKPLKGSKVLRILPYVVSDPHHPDRVPVGELWWRRPLKVHRSVGPEEKTRVCPTTFGKRCPICQYASERKRSGEATEEELRDLRPKDRDFFLVVDPAEPDVIMGWEISFYNFTKQLMREIDDAPDERAGFADLIDGMDLRIRFVESSMGTTKFFEADRIDFLPRKNPPDPNILSEIPDLDKMLNVLGYEELESEFFGIPTGGDAADQTAEPEEVYEEEETEEEVYEEEPAEEEVYEEEETEEEPEPPPVRRTPVAKQTPKPAATNPVRKQAPAPQKQSSPPTRRPPAVPPKSAPVEEEPEAGGACPAGGNFGTDCNALTECDACDIWDECQTEFDRQVAARRAAKSKK